MKQENMFLATALSVSQIFYFKIKLELLLSTVNEQDFHLRLKLAF
jgi:hypothetical protein